MGAMRPGERAPTFTIARNPEADSTLLYLLRVPLPDHPLVLKARDTWPRTAKVYCHRATHWPEYPDIVEEVPVRSCVRRGVAIDLVLDRGRENRSQFVFARIQGGREGIFWQSPKTTRKTRAGIRIPARRAAGQRSFTVYVDTREKYAYKFSKQQAVTERRALPSGDYAVAVDDEVVAVVERKTLADLAKGLVDGSLAFAMAELGTVGRAAIVVEDRWADVFRLEHVAPGWIAELLAAVQVRYPQVPIAFCENRALAEEWTYRFLGAARAYAIAETEALDEG
jgi:hypothetical protein